MSQSTDLNSNQCEPQAVTQLEADNSGGKIPPSRRTAVGYGDSDDAESMRKGLKLLRDKDAAIGSSLYAEGRVVTAVNSELSDGVILQLAWNPLPEVTPADIEVVCNKIARFALGCGDSEIMKRALEELPLDSTQKLFISHASIVRLARAQAPRHGVIGSYLHRGKTGVLDVLSASTEVPLEVLALLAHDVALHIVAANPQPNSGTDLIEQALEIPFIKENNISLAAYLLEQGALLNAELEVTEVIVFST